MGRGIKDAGETAGICRYCQRARNCINGRYCFVLRRYVQYDCRQECDYFQQEMETNKTARQ